MNIIEPKTRLVLRVIFYAVISFALAGWDVVGTAAEKDVAAAELAPRLSRLERLIDRQHQKFCIPGLAIAIVLKR